MRARRRPRRRSRPTRRQQRGRRRRPAATRMPAHASSASPLQPELHQIGIERRERAVERAGQRLHRLERRSAATCSRALGILEPGADAHRQLAGVGHQLGAAGGVERRIDLARNSRRAARAGWRRRAWPPRSDSARRGATSEPPMNTIGAMPIDQAELAERVGDVDLGVAVRQLAARAQRERAARDLRRCSAMPGAALGMARHEDRQQARESCACSRRCTSITRGLLARMGRGGGDHRPLADRVLQRRELRRRRPAAPARRA